MIVLGPVLRFVDATRATLWFETDAPAEIVVRCAGAGEHAARTWCVHGHHYALVQVTGLAPATTTAYTVHLAGEQVWPPAGSAFPPSVIRTLDEGARFRFAFGSCRVAAPFDAENLDRFGADALVALAERMRDGSVDEWPDALFLAGDQIYADEPSDELRARLRAAHRAGPDDDRHEADDVREEIGDFEQYTWLYHESWTPEPIRWLFSTVPTLMLLDDHDLRDDWNTSQAWRDRVTRERWWHDRVTGAFASYWVYQHLGNLSPDDLPDDPMWPVVTSGIGDDERTQRLDEFARRSDAQPDSARWSFHRDFGPRVRLVAVDARCSRVLDPADRHIVDPVETRWLVERATERPVTHLLLGSTLPFLLTPGVHHLEGWDEAVAGGAWGRRAVGTAERIRQGLDLEHWAAFRRSFDAVVELLARIGSGECPPRTITLLGGDVHCSYTALAEVAGVDPTRTAIRQLTMSPFRNPLQRSVRAVQRAMTTRPVVAALRRLARSAGVVEPPISWYVDHGPWFGNGVMTVVVDGEEATVEVDHAAVRGTRQCLVRTLTLSLTAPPRG